MDLATLTNDDNFRQFNNHNKLIYLTPWIICVIILFLILKH